MATLSITHSFVAGTLAKAEEVNQNFNDIINWSTQIADDNLATFSGPITWNVTTNKKALDITTTSTIGSISLTHNSNTLQANSPLIKIVDNAGTQNNAGVSMLHLEATGTSHAVPLLNLKTAGTGAFLIAADGLGAEKFKVDNDGSITTGTIIASSGTLLLSGAATVTGNVAINGGQVTSTASELSLDSAATLRLKRNTVADGDMDVVGRVSGGKIISQEGVYIDSSDTGGTNAYVLRKNNAAVEVTVPTLTPGMPLSYGHAGSSNALIIDVAKVEKNVTIDQYGVVLSEGALVFSDLPPGISLNTSIVSGELEMTFVRNSGGSIYGYVVEEWNSSGDANDWGVQKSSSKRAGLTNTDAIQLRFGPRTGYLTASGGTIGVRVILTIYRKHDA